MAAQAAASFQWKENSFLCFKGSLGFLKMKIWPCHHFFYFAASTSLLQRLPAFPLSHCNRFTAQSDDTLLKTMGLLTQTKGSRRRLIIPTQRLSKKRMKTVIGRLSSSLKHAVSGWPALWWESCKRGFKYALDDCIHGPEVDYGFKCSYSIVIYSFL